MCLSLVTAKEFKKDKIYKGIKKFKIYPNGRLTGPTYDFGFVKGVWLEDLNNDQTQLTLHEKLRTEDQAYGVFSLGFHILADNEKNRKKAAEKRKILKIKYPKFIMGCTSGFLPVYFREVVCCGIDDTTIRGAKTYIARQIYIPKTANGLPPELRKKEIMKKETCMRREKRRR